MKKNFLKLLIALIVMLSANLLISCGKENLKITRVYITVNNETAFKTNYNYGEDAFSLNDIKVILEYSNNSTKTLTNVQEHLSCVKIDNNINVNSLPDFLTNNTGSTYNSVPGNYYFEVNVENAPKFEFTITINKASVENFTIEACYNSQPILSEFNMEWNNKIESDLISFSSNLNNANVVYISANVLDEFLTSTHSDAEIYNFVLLNKTNLSFSELIPNRYYAVAIKEENDYYKGSISSNKIEFTIVNKILEDDNKFYLTHTLNSLENYKFNSVYELLNNEYLFTNIASENKNMEVDFFLNIFNTSTKEWERVSYSSLVNEDIFTYAINDVDGYSPVEYKNNKWYKLGTFVEVEQNNIIKVDYTDIYDYKEGLSVVVPIYSTFAYAGNELFYNFNDLFVDYLTINKATINVAHASEYYSAITYTENNATKEENKNLILNFIKNNYDLTIQNLLVLPNEIDLSVGEHEFNLSLSSVNLEFIIDNKVEKCNFKYVVCKANQIVQTTEVFNLHFNLQGKIDLREVNFVGNIISGVKVKNLTYTLLDTADYNTTGTAVINDNCLVADLNSVTNPNGDFYIKVTLAGNENYNDYEFVVKITTGLISEQVLISEFNNHMLTLTNYNDSGLTIKDTDIFNDIISVPNSIYSEFGVWKWYISENEILNTQTFNENFTATCKFIVNNNCKWLIEDCETDVFVEILKTDVSGGDQCKHELVENGFCSECLAFVGETIEFSDIIEIELQEDNNFYKIVNMPESITSLFVDGGFIISIIDANLNELETDGTSCNFVIEENNFLYLNLSTGVSSFITLNFM